MRTLCAYRAHCLSGASCCRLRWARHRRCDGARRRGPRRRMCSPGDSARVHPGAGSRFATAGELRACKVGAWLGNVGSNELGVWVAGRCSDLAPAAVFLVKNAFPLCAEKAPCLQAGAGRRSQDRRFFRAPRPRGARYKSAKTFLLYKQPLPRPCKNSEFRRFVPKPTYDSKTGDSRLG